MRRSVILGLALLAAGCRYRPAVVPTIGPHADMDLMIGEWDGEYWSDESGRHGSILFNITAHGDSAFGDVLMRVPAGEVAPRPVDLAAGHTIHARAADLLSIRFVRIEGGRVQGELEPYIAPDCECVARTTFTGTVAGDEVTGTYVTVREHAATQRGEWKVRRIPVP